MRARLKIKRPIEEPNSEEQRVDVTVEKTYHNFRPYYTIRMAYEHTLTAMELDIEGDTFDVLLKNASKDRNKRPQATS